MSGEDRSFGGVVKRCAAACAEPFYRGIIALRNRAYDRGGGVRHATLPVVSIGNITTGGTGKTPMVMHIVRRLQYFQRRPAVILRGYGSTNEQPSDERQLFVQQFDDVPVIAEPDRLTAAQTVAREHPDVDVLVLDDAFQHRRIARDLDLVLIDATNPFGFEHMLPRGLLREPLRNLRRADAVIVTRADQVDHATLKEVDARIGEYHGRIPIAHAAHEWSGVLDQHDAPVQADGARVLVLAGIGNPAAFVAQTRQRFDVIEVRALPDHAVYTHESIEQLQHVINRCDPAAVLTTEKDWVKLRPRIESSTLSVPIWRPVVSMKLLDGSEALDDLLANVPRTSSRT